MSGAMAMCQKMLDEDAVIIKELRDENKALKDELESLRARTPQNESEAILKMRAEVAAYKHTIELLSQQIIVLKKKTSM